MSSVVETTAIMFQTYSSAMVGMTRNKIKIFHCPVRDIIWVET